MLTTITDRTEAPNAIFSGMPKRVIIRKTASESISPMMATA